MKTPRNKGNSIPNFSIHIPRTIILDIFKHHDADTNDTFYNVLISFILNDGDKDKDSENNVVIKSDELRLISIVTDVTGETIEDVLGHSLEGITMLFDTIYSHVIVHDADSGEEIEVIDLNDTDYITDIEELEGEHPLTTPPTKQVLH